MFRIDSSDISASIHATILITAVGKHVVRLGISSPMALYIRTEFTENDISLDGPYAGEQALFLASRDSELRIVAVDTQLWYVS